MQSVFGRSCNTEPQSPEHTMRSCTQYTEAKTKHVATTLEEQIWGNKDKHTQTLLMMRNTHTHKKHLAKTVTLAPFCVSSHQF